MKDQPIWKAHSTGAVASALAALLWLVLAWRSPTSTHHFAPMVVAGIWGYLTRKGTLPSPPAADRLLMLVGPLLLALAAQFALMAASKLDGPPLIPALPVPLELLIMALIGSVVGSGAWCLVARSQSATE